MKTELQFSLFLFLDLERGNWSALGAGRFTPDETATGLISILDISEKRKVSSLSPKPNHDYTVIQRVSMSYYRLSYPGSPSVINTYKHLCFLY